MGIAYMDNNADEEAGAAVAAADEDSNAAVRELGLSKPMEDDANADLDKDAGDSAADDPADVDLKVGVPTARRRLCSARVGEKADSRFGEDSEKEETEEDEEDEEDGKDGTAATPVPGTGLDFGDAATMLFSFTGDPRGDSKPGRRVGIGADRVRDMLLMLLRVLPVPVLLPLPLEVLSCCAHISSIDCILLSRSSNDSRVPNMNGDTH